MSENPRLKEIRSEYRLLLQHLDRRYNKAFIVAFLPHIVVSLCSVDIHSMHLCSSFGCIYRMKNNSEQSRTALGAQR